MPAKTKPAAAKTKAKTKAQATAPVKQQPVAKAPAVMELAAPMTPGLDLYCELDAGGGDIFRLEHNGKRYIVRKAQTVGEPGNADFQVAAWRICAEVDRMSDAIRRFADMIDQIDGAEPAGSPTPATQALGQMMDMAVATMNGRSLAPAASVVDAPVTGPAHADDPAWPAGISFRDDAFRDDRRLLLIRRFCAWVAATFPRYSLRIARTVAAERNICAIEAAETRNDDRPMNWRSIAFVRRHDPAMVMAMSAALADDQNITKPAGLEKLLWAISSHLAEPREKLPAPDLSVDPFAAATPAASVEAAPVAQPAGEVLEFGQAYDLAGNDPERMWHAIERALGNRDHGYAALSAEDKAKVVAVLRQPDPTARYADWVDGATDFKVEDLDRAFAEAAKAGEREPFATWLRQQRPDLAGPIAERLGVVAVKPAAAPAEKPKAPVKAVIAAKAAAKTPAKAARR